MTVKRRTFVLGALSGASLLALTACTNGEPPVPTPSPTRQNPTVPQPTAFWRSEWTSDPFSRGAFSYQRVGSTPDQRTTLRQPLGERVFFAGEHTSETFPGTVNGARASGHRAATEVIDLAEPGERIAVIGAGIAGATAARRLADEGFSVVVIEGRERSGGRIHTLEVNDESHVELGAAWVRSSSTNPLEKELDDAGITTRRFNYEWEHRTPDGTVVDTGTIGPDTVVTAIDWASEQPADVSMAAAIEGSTDLDDRPNEQGVSEVDLVADYVTTNLVIPTGAEPDDLSAWYAPDATLSPEDDRLVTGGLSRFVEELLDGIDVLPSSAVASVSHGDDGVTMRLARGESLSAARAVVTVPLGVLQSGSIEFDPPLPFSHRGAISALGMGSQDKLVLQFEERFWSTDATVWSVVDAETELPLWFNVEPSTGDNILVALFGGEDAERLAELSDNDLVAAALRSLEPFVADQTEEGDGS